MTDYISPYLIFYSIFIAIFIFIYWVNYIFRQKKSITKFSDKSHIFAELLMAISLLSSSTQISNYLKINQTIILFFSSLNLANSIFFFLFPIFEPIDRKAILACFSNIS